MAQQGMFGNQYQQAVTDETALRQQQSQTGGLTGWAAITNAMSGIGSELGYQGGQVMGGQTPAQAQQARFQSVIDSVPDYDPMNPESVQQMSSALWNGGFYDEGMAALNQSKAMQLDNAKIALYEAQARDEDTVDGPSPTEVIAINKDERNALATKLVSSMPVTTSAEIQSVANVLRSGGYADTSQYKDLMRNLTTRLSYESKEEATIQTDLEQEQKAEEIDTTLRYKPVMEVGKGVALVDGFFINNAPVGLGNEDTQALSKQIGGLIETYDNTLATARGSISPGEASSFYTKVLGMPDVYQANESNQAGLPIPFLEGTVDLPIFGKTNADVFKGYKFDPEAFEGVLDTVFSRNGKEITTTAQLDDFVRRGLVIPGVTVINGGGGNVGVMTAGQLQTHLERLNSDVPMGN